MRATLQPQQFSVRSDHSGSQAVVVPQGDLDLATVLELQRAFEEVVARGAESVVVDLGELKFIDSTGLRQLLTLARGAPHDGFRLELLPGSPTVMRLFELTGTLDLLPFRTS